MSIEKRAVRNLLEIVSAYRKATRESLQACSKRFYGDAYFFDKLKAGDGSLSLKTLDKVLDKIREAWPEKAIWPMVRLISMDQRPQKK